MIFCCLILVFVPEPVLPDEIDEQTPQHQVDDDERDGEPQGRIEDVIVEIHITCGSIIFFTNLPKATRKICLDSLFNVLIRDFTCLKTQNKTNI
jgi:hypothetical protein